ncbi:zinc finger domain-containing protein [Ophiocordyceps sinensis CO18]|uniref:Zinc finger domain-containing protein n=1 Tax=Ophiocordyceps sinensis (strain Co18 / CGMCC 3.14243) TaxID=911162 RepID=T5AL56_OPHSC|nr:zinc finger domain-containing protein [Ophiocordyceps sinensis CO18]
MPQYRIEISPNNRAGCKDKVCKDNAVKIAKGEIRFGSWVEVNEHGSWHWKHWGCVSGAQVMHLQEACDEGDGNLKFDAIDGFDELGDHAEIQEKIRRCVRQGHVDPEDFMGDPEKNVPHEAGIRLTAKQRAAKEKAAAAEDNSDEDNAPKKKVAKRGRKKADVDDENEQPAVKKAKPSNYSVVEDESDAAVTDDEEAPVKKTRKPAAKARGKANDDANDAPKQRRRSSRVVAKSSTEEDESVESDEEPAPAAKSKRGARSKEPAAEQAIPRRGRTRKT